MTTEKQQKLKPKRLAGQLFRQAVESSLAYPTGTNDEFIGALVMQALVELGALKRPSDKKAKDTAAADLIKHYCDEYMRLKNVMPKILPPDAGAVKAVLKVMDLQQAKELVTAYLEWKEPWFVRKGHDLPTFAGNVNRVIQRRENGASQSVVEAQHEERSDYHRTQLELIAKGQL